MNELSRHIEHLLLSHDCVVVPQFGGFVTMTTNAMREETEQLFFPPIRVVRFNPDLTEDDGLLTALVREEHHCAPSEAKRYIQHLVLNLRQQLLADGQADFGSIGLFQQDEDGHVSFSPCQAGVITPQYFGLDAFYMPKLTAAQRNSLRRGSKRERLQHQNSHDSQSITIHINKRSLKNVVTTAAIILLCALFSSPVEETMNFGNQASILPSEPTTKIIQSPSVSESISMAEAETIPPVTETSALKESVAEESITEENHAVEESINHSPATAITTSESTPTGNYCIVLASNVSKKNANNYVELLKERGILDARVYNNGKMNRVIIDGFTSMEEANERNIELHRSNREYASSWVMAL